MISDLYFFDWQPCTLEELGTHGRFITAIRSLDLAASDEVVFDVVMADRLSRVMCRHRRGEDWNFHCGYLGLRGGLKEVQRFFISSELSYAVLYRKALSNPADDLERLIRDRCLAFKRWPPRWIIEAISEMSPSAMVSKV